MFFQLHFYFLIDTMSFYVGWFVIMSPKFEMLINLSSISSYLWVRFWVTLAESERLMLFPAKYFIISYINHRNKPKILTEFSKND